MNGPASPPEDSQATDAQLRARLEEAHSLLSTLRSKLNQHPELEQAIERLEMALSTLTVRTGGML